MDLSDPVSRALLMTQVAGIIETNAPVHPVILFVSGDQIHYLAGEDLAGEGYDLASLTKVFVAARALRLESEGLVDLDSFASGTHDAEPRGSTQQTPTLRHLLAHTSGLKAGTAKEGVDHDPWSPQFAHPPGLLRDYQNLNYVLVAHALDQQTGKAWHEGMVEWGVGLHPMPPIDAWPGAMGLGGTPQGLANLTRDWLGGGAILPRPAEFTMGGVQTSRGLAPLGWQGAIGPPNDPAVLLATGSNALAGAEWRVYPGQGAGMVILTQSRYDPIFFGEVVELLEGMLLPGLTPDCAIPPHPVAPGIYRDPGRERPSVSLRLRMDGADSDPLLIVEQLGAAVPPEDILREISPGFWMDRDLALPGGVEAPPMPPMPINGASAELIVLMDPGARQVVGVIHRGHYYQRE